MVSAAPLPVALVRSFCNGYGTHGSVAAPLSTQLSAAPAHVSQAGDVPELDSAPVYDVSDFFGDDMEDFIFGPPLPFRSLEEMWMHLADQGAQLRQQLSSALACTAQFVVRHRLSIACLVVAWQALRC